MRLMRTILLVGTLLAVGATATTAQPPADTGPTVVVNVGDSITQGVQGAGDYSTELGQLMGKRYKVVNAGKSGGAYTRSNRRDYRLTPQFQTAIASKPDIVTIMLGTNDAKVNPTNAQQDVWGKAQVNFEADVRQLVETFKNLPTSPKVYICLPPPASNDNRHSIMGDIVRQQILPILERVAVQERVGVIDLFHTEMEGTTGDGQASGPRGTPPTKYFLDGVHPNKAGNSLIAHKMAEVLLRYPPTIQQIYDSRTRLEALEAFMPYGVGTEPPKLAGCLWYRDGAPLSKEAGGDARRLVAPKPGSYQVAVRLSADAMDRMVSDPLVYPFVPPPNDGTISIPEEFRNVK